jgi:2-amino-4-hydroxy-6-hydroxymethyldihydropteridine diphosphokinase
MSDASYPVILAFGSNLGDRLGALRAAIKAVATYMDIKAVSPVYETLPAYVLDQPAFLNAVCIGTTKVEPLALLWAIKDIESQVGRQPTYRYGPRVIDVDLIAHGDSVIATHELTLPHPRIEERDFVLRPLADIAPQWRHPNGKTVAEMLAQLPPGEISLISETL